MVVSQGFKLVGPSRKLLGLFLSEEEVNAKKERLLNDGIACAVIPWIETDDFRTDTLKQVIRILRDDSFSVTLF